MKLFAKKPCSFCGKKFFIDDEIPSEYVLDPKAQEKMGVLVVVGENSGNADSVEGGSLLPPSPTLENTVSKEEKIYSKTALAKMNKDDLLAAAAEKGVEATAEMTNAAIVKLILEKQGE